MKYINIIFLTCIILATFCGCKKADTTSETEKPAEIQNETATAPDESAPEAKADKNEAAPANADEVKSDEVKSNDAAPAGNDEIKANDAPAPSDDAGTKSFDVTFAGIQYKADTTNPKTAPDPDNPHEVYCPDDAKCAGTIRFTGTGKIPPLLVLETSYIEAQSLGDLDGDGNDEIAVLYTNTAPIDKWRVFRIYSLKGETNRQAWTEIAPDLQTNLFILWSNPYIPVEKSNTPGFVKVRHVDATDPIDVETFKVIEKEVEITKLRDYVPQDSGRKE